MRALVYHGKKDIRFDTVPDPVIEEPRDAIIKVTSCAICGSDLHLFDGFFMGMKNGDIIGHEFMGEVVEVGSGNKKLKVGDRVVVPFNIACGECEPCKLGKYAGCERSNPNKELADKALGHTGAAAFGYTHLTGGIPGGQAEFVRVPYADVGPLKVNGGLTDEQVLFLGDILPTGWQAAMQCEIQPTDTVAIWGAGPVGQFCLKSALLMKPKQVVMIDKVPERLAMARAAGAVTIDFSQESVIDRLNELTGGKGPEKCIDAVGMEADVSMKHFDAVMDRAKQAVMLENDRPHVLREMIYVCRPGGILSVPGVYSGLVDKIPFGILMNKGLTLRTGQTHVKYWYEDLLRRIEEGEIDASSIITHTVPLEKGPEMYKVFREKEDGCIKVVLKP